MSNVFFYVGGYPIYSYGFALGIGMLFGSLLAMREAKRKGIGAKRMTDFVIGGAITFLVVGQVVSAFMELGARVVIRPYMLLTAMEQGVHIPSGLIGFLLFTALFANHNNLIMGVFLDVLAPGIALLLAIAHLGSDVYGRVSDKLWAVDFGQMYVHPIQLYASIGYYTIFSMLWRSRKNTRFDGQLFLGLLALGAFLRFLLSFWQETGGASYGPFFPALLVVFLGGLWVLAYKNSPRAQGNRIRSFRRFFMGFFGYILVVFTFVTAFFWRIS